jgi:cyanophycin synthetase
VVTNIGEGDHLGLSGIETLEKLALVKRTIVDVVLPNGSAVLKADDPLVAEMAPKCPGSVIFFCRDGEHAVIREARARGGRAVIVRDDHIVLAEGNRETVLAALASVPLTYHGRVPFQVENVLAAAAAAWSMGISLDMIRMALATFAGDTQQAPGRFNVLEANGATIIVDYGHNPSAVAALIEALEVFPHKRRSIVFSAEGDRRDEHILRQMELVGEAFDTVILYEYSDRRGRAEGEILALLHQGLVTGTRVSETLDVADEPAAIALALQMLEPGDLLVIQAKEIDNVLADVTRALAEDPPKAVESGERVLAAPFVS